MNHYWPGDGRARPARRRSAVLFILGGFLRVRVCDLCGALVLAAAAHQHDAVHRVELGRHRRG